MAVVGSGAGMSAFDANRLRCVGWQLSLVCSMPHRVIGWLQLGQFSWLVANMPLHMLLCGCSTLRAEAESWKDRSESLMGQVRELQRQQQVSVGALAGGCRQGAVVHTHRNLHAKAARAGCPAGSDWSDPQLPSLHCSALTHRRPQTLKRRSWRTLQPHWARSARGWSRSSRQRATRWHLCAQWRTRWGTCSSGWKLGTLSAMHVLLMGNRNAGFQGCLCREADPSSLETPTLGHLVSSLRRAVAASSRSCSARRATWGGRWQRRMHRLL